MSPALAEVLFTTEPPFADNLAILAQILSLVKNKQQRKTPSFLLRHWVTNMFFKDFF